MWFGIGRRILKASSCGSLARLIKVETDIRLGKKTVSDFFRSLNSLIKAKASLINDTSSELFALILKSIGLALRTNSPLFAIWISRLETRGQVPVRGCS